MNLVETSEAPDDRIHIVRPHKSISRSQRNYNKHNHYHRRAHSKSSSSYSSRTSLSSDLLYPPLIPDPTAPPTSIDSPPSYTTRTLPPPKTKTHAASTQTHYHTTKRRHTESSQARRYNTSTHFQSEKNYKSSISKQSRVPSSKQPNKSPSPITLDPATLGKFPGPKNVSHPLDNQLNSQEEYKSVADFQSKHFVKYDSVSQEAEKDLTVHQLTTCNVPPCSNHNNKEVTSPNNTRIVLK